MSTRNNVVIIKKIENSNDLMYNTMYRHCDGYPTGAGQILQDFLNTVAKDSNNDVDDFANRIHRYDIDFEKEGSILCCHGDIEYLYLINLDNSTITCYNIGFIDYKIQLMHPERFVNFKDLVDNKHDNSGLVSKIYEASFADKFSDIKI